MRYDINMIEQEMTAAGSHWWDRSSMRFFRCRVNDQVYQGTGGVYFVTSEKYSDEPRKYTVRQYNPATKEVNTVGDFNSMTRSAAHGLAKKMAGDALDITTTVHIETTAAQQLAIDIVRNGGRCSIKTAGDLIRLAKRHHKLIEDHCNGVEVYGADDEPKAPLRNNRQSLTGLAAKCLCGVVFAGDPRGCTVKLTLPSGETNDWGKDGWCIPTN